MLLRILEPWWLKPETYCANLPFMDERFPPDAVSSGKRGGEVYDEGHLRRYLLGELNEEEQQAVEEGLLTDDESFDLLLAAEDELIDDYVSGALSAEERRRFEGFFLSTSERQRKLSFAMALRRYITAEGAAVTTQAESVKPSPGVIARPSLVIGRLSLWWKQAFSSPYLRMVAAAIVVLGLGLGIWRVFFYQSEVAKGMASLAKAYRVERPTEARITGLNYAPLSNTRGTEQPKVDELALDRAERILLDEVAEHPSPASHHALGRLYLVKRNFDKAIAQFDQALKEAPSNAQLHVDYGAALLEKGKADRLGDDSGKGLEELARSLEHLNKALELDDSLLEALFNRALVHQEMMLPEQAEQDWRKYLEKDSSSKWADEATQNLKQLEERRNKTSRTKEEILQDFLSAYEAHDEERAWQVISQSREALSRKLLWEQLLDAYLAASLEGQSAYAKSKLQALGYLGQLEAKRAGDLYTSGLAQFYYLSSARRVKALTRARDLMKLGHEYYARAEPLKAIDTFSEARKIFVQIGDKSENQYAEHWLGCSYLEAGKAQQGISQLEQLARSFERQNLKWLLMRTLQSLSGAQYSIHQYSKGISYGHRALALAESINDRIGNFNTLSMLAEEYRYIANYQQSLTCGQRSLAAMDSCALNENQISRHFHIISSAFASSGLYAAAIDYEKETLRRALTIGHTQLISLAYAQLGTIYGKEGQLSEALVNTQLAYEAAKTQADQAIRAKMLANSSLQMGDLYREVADFEKAISSYDESIQLYTALDLRYNLYQAQKGKLLCFISQANDSLARQELETTLGLFEKYRSGILREEDKNRFFDIEQSVYDIAIDFEYSRANDPQKAFEYSEQSRSRSLLDSVTGKAGISYENEEPDVTSNSVSQPLKFREVLERLPDQTQILQYVVLNDKLLTWVISKTTFSTIEQKIAQQELSEKIVNYLQLVSCTAEGKGEDVRGAAKDLFNILIRPADPLLDRNKRLCIVPDKHLNYLPWAALISPDSGRFLLEDYSLILSPSSSLLIICSETASKKEGTRVERLLSVGNPRFDRRAFGSLPDLPSAGREAERVAAYYRSARLLIGDSATEERVKSEMPRSDIVHFALHSVIDERSPMRSKLLLAAEPNAAGHPLASDGVLEAHEIYRLKLPQTRIVVLSACQTGVERYYRGEGMISMARPFIAAGVPLLVVSLWPVDSDATAEMMINFHKHRKLENLSTTEALRRAQLDMLNSNVQRFHQPYCWAAFVAIGGYTSF